MMFLRLQGISHSRSFFFFNKSCGRMNLQFVYSDVRRMCSGLILHLTFKEVRSCGVIVNCSEANNYCSWQKPQFESKPIQLPLSFGVTMASYRQLSAVGNRDTKTHKRNLCTGCFFTTIYNFLSAFEMCAIVSSFRRTISMKSFTCLIFLVPSLLLALPTVIIASFTT